MQFQDKDRGFEVARGFEGANVILPQRQTSRSAGYDFRALEGTIILPNGRAMFSTGVKAFMRPFEVLMIYSRSSLGIKRGLVVAQSVGVIDSDYYGNPDNDGHIVIALLNLSNTAQKIEKGERIAQGVFMRFLDCGDRPSEVRAGGIGSTGK